MAWAYQYCKDLQNRVGPCPDLQVRENQEQKCKNLEAIAQQFVPAGRPAHSPSSADQDDSDTTNPCSDRENGQDWLHKLQKLRNFS